MASQGWILALCFSLASVFGTTESVTTAHTQKYTCRTFGSGVVQPFNGSSFYVRSNCPFTFTHFTHNRVECDITVQRGASGLLVQVEIIINKVRTILRNGSILVEMKSVSLPYDHTYQHIFRYGIYTRLRSTLLPLSVTWHNAAKGIDTLWVELDQELSADMTGLCGKHNMPANKQLLITESVLSEDTCQTRDPVAASSKVCSEFFSHTLDCLQAQTPHYIQLCGKNSYTYENSKSINCAFFKEIVWRCGNTSYVWNLWRALTQCAPPTCPGDLVYVEQGPAFVPSCSNPNPRLTSQDLTSSCICPNGKVLNDRSDGFHCVDKSSCSCVFAGQSFATGDIRSTKCQSCRCNGGKWICSGNFCPARCLIEGQFVTTFDGKRYIVPGKCTYVASQGLNWTITVEFSQKEPSLKTVVLQLFQEIYTFTQNTLKFGDQEITELHQSDHALVFWQSSMYVQVHTSFDMKIQVQMSPEIQLYITPPRNYNGVISGLCGNSNNDTTDDFTTSSGIVENSAQPFALSWSVGSCAVNIPPTCVSADNEIFADEKCAVLNNPTGIFAPCHGHIPTDEYHTACIQRTCNCGSNLLQCWCVALSSYAKACAGLGIEVGDWRKATNCTLKCQKNQEFSYDVLACNRTCLSLSGPDPRCGLEDAPVEGCGCPKETHLNVGHTCTPKAECPCHYNGGTTPPGHVVIDGRQCLCENGELHCSKDCGCMNGKVCVHCSEYPVNTAQKTCDSLSRPLGTNMTCVSGCYCPYDQYEDHHGNCVSVHNCTCMYSGKVFGAGEHVKTKCKTCVCGQGQWHCTDEPCPGTCQVYGNGHYQTFDTKWYRFDGHCQYTLVEDYCGSTNGTFSVRVESVPCCDEALTCSRSIVLDLQNKVTLTMSDMKVTKQIQNGWTVEQDLLFTTHTVGLYIIISVPSRGITLIWDKHTRITIELHQKWRNKVCGLCGNFDSNEMNDLETRGSAVLAGPLDFGNSWKAATPPCSDVTTEIFPCERNSYCSAWAQRRCMILRGDTFKDCHFKVDPEPYYQACVQESCSCEFEGKFLGFCTAVAAYAEACSDQDVCINWRTPDLCPVYCDYYNEQGQCSWHYEACGRTLTCGNYLSHKLEGCYPKCPKEVPFYDENTGECTTLKNCTCYFNDTVIPSGKVLIINSIECPCENGIISCFESSTPPCKCTDVKREEMWDCGDTWVEDCFYKNCTEGKIELTSLPRPEITVPTCPRGLLTYVSDGCYDIPKCNCQCELYGDPHYISFQGVTFDFLDECTYILVEERSPLHHLTIAVDNFYCIPGLQGSCAKGIILKYKNNIATLSIVPDLFAVQATLNNVTIQPPYEEHGLKFETTGYKVSIYLPEIRSFVSLTPTYNLVVNLAMEHFVNNTQGQCGVCGGASCVRKGGKIEDDTCCDKTAYDWVYPDPLKPACVSAPRDVPCFSVTTPTATPSTCPPSPLCELLDHPVFESCRQHVDLSLKKKNCKFDSCHNPNGFCSSLEQAAEECKAVGFCIDWRKLTNGICDVPCRKGLVYRECQNKLDDFCYGGKRYPGSSLEKSSTGCFCPPNLIRAGKYSDVCLPDCDYCKGPDGTIKLPGEVWQSNCQLCRCNNQTLTEECSPKPPKPAPLCGPYAVLKNTSCCGDPVCVDQNCIYQGQTYRLGDKWTDPAHPCMSFSCSADGILTEARACSTESCPEEDRIWDGQSCFTCNQTCAPRVSSVNITVDNCTAVAQMPVCKGQCASHVRVVLNGDLRVQQDSRCCQERDSVERMVTLQCSDLTSRRYAYRHITRCECRTCGIWR